MTLRLSCQHGKYDDHYPPNEDLPDWQHKYGLMGYERETKGWFWCPGGREATPEDVYGALGGEKVWWCEVHDSQQTKRDLEWCWSSEQRQERHKCRMVERILTPALDQEAPR